MVSFKNSAPAEARAARISIFNWRGALRRFSSLTGAMACLSGLLLFTACDDAEQAVESVVEPLYAVQASAYAITPESTTVAVGKYFRFRAIRTDGSGRSVSVKWSTPNTNLIKTYSDGYVKGLANGVATLTAYSSTYGTATAKVIVGTGGTTTTTTTTTTSPVLTTVAVTPATVSVAAGATTQLTAVGKDQNGNPMSGVVTFTWASANAAVATVSATGLVTGVAGGEVAIAATGGGKTGSAMVTVTAAAGMASGTTAPPNTGIWIGKAELDAIPMGSNGWTGTGELKATADAAWTLQAVETQDQTYNIHVMAGALAFARLYPDPSAETYRTKVVQALRQVMALADLDTAEVTFVSRNLGTFVIAADLINLRAHDPALDNQFRTWLTHKLDNQYTGGGGAPSVRVAAWDRPNNIGAYSRFSLAAAAVYLGDRATLDRIALVMRRWLGNTSVNHSFKWYNVQYTWQMNPSSSATWVGINPKGAVRDGHNFDGLQPEEQERGLPMAYDPAAFPNNYSAVRYNEVALEASLAAVLILHRAGYTDLIDASDQAMLRAAKWIKWAADTHAAKGYKYFTENREAARPLINYVYRSAGLPESRVRSQLAGRAFGFSWTYWTHGGRSIR